LLLSPLVLLPPVAACSNDDDDLEGDEADPPPAANDAIARLYVRVVTAVVQVGGALANSIIFMLQARCDLLEQLPMGSVYVDSLLLQEFWRTLTEIQTTDCENEIA